MKEIDDFFAEAARKNAEGTLTIGTAVHFGFYRLLEGEHAGRVVIKTSSSRVDNKPILYFANEMTWIYVEQLKDIRCELTRPTFPPSQHEIDRSKAHWYSDGGIYQHYEW